MLDVPVAIIFFIRPDKLSVVFDQIKKVKPKKLFLIQDGPRINNYDSDMKKILECRKIFEGIDWECEVFKNYSEVNLGVGKRPASGISWVFSIVSQAIILEDDCVPNLSFFTFCEEMLKLYKNNNNIMLISGMNLLERYNNSYSYTFSKACTIGAWATWKRVWDLYDFKLKDFDDKKLRKNIKYKIPFKNVRSSKFYAWQLTRSMAKNNEPIPWWDYQLLFLIYRYDGLGIVPSRNLITNIGYGEGATNLSNKSKERHFNIKSFNMQKKIKHPTEIKWDLNFDEMLYKTQKIKVNKIRIFLSKLKRILKRIFN